jgi:hypothetical protein
MARSAEPYEFDDDSDLYWASDRLTLWRIFEQVSNRGVLASNPQEALKHTKQIFRAKHPGCPWPFANKYILKIWPKYKSDPTFWHNLSI